MCNDRNRITDFRPADDPLFTVSEGARILGYGSVATRREPINGARGPLLKLKDVAYVPEVPANISQALSLRSRTWTGTSSLKCYELQAILQDLRAF